MKGLCERGYEVHVLLKVMFSHFLIPTARRLPGWAEPLLARIAEDEKNVVCPAIEVLNADNFAYQASTNAEQRGGFNWDLFFKWKGIPPEEQKLRKDDSDPIR